MHFINLRHRRIAQQALLIEIKQGLTNKGLLRKSQVFSMQGAEVQMVVYTSKRGNAAVGIPVAPVQNIDFNILVLQTIHALALKNCASFEKIMK